MPRTFGWIQDPTKFDKLRTIIEIFDTNTLTRQNLSNKINQNPPKNRSGNIDIDRKNNLLNALQRQGNYFFYDELTSSRYGFKNDSLIQIAIDVGRWADENFLRWAHAICLLEYDRSNDSFKLTSQGNSLINSQRNSQQEIQIFEECMLFNSPNVRVLDLLSGGQHLTEFEIGEKLGFIGENGFTHLSQNGLIYALATVKDDKEKRNIYENWEGSSDKYARGICERMKKLGWVNKIPKNITVQYGQLSYAESIDDSYVITNNGEIARRKGRGLSRYQRSIKFVPYEMLCSPKEKNWKYKRLKRAELIKCLQNHPNGLTIQAIQLQLQNIGISPTTDELIYDIECLVNMGLEIQNGKTLYKLKDSIKLDAPQLITIPTITQPTILQYIYQIRANLISVPSHFICIIQNSFDKKQARFFETNTFDLLKRMCGFDGIYLGGANQPDMILWFIDRINSSNSYGVIVDCKSRKDGFSIPSTERRQIIDYITDNQQRQNTNFWYNLFPNSINKFYFLFISSKFIGNFKKRLNNIHSKTKIKGSVISSTNLLLLVEKIKSKNISLDKIEKLFAKLDEIDNNDINSL